MSVEWVMAKPTTNFPRAMKHGGYSNTTLLPNEDANAFQKLHDGLRNELIPSGPLEEDVVLSIAHLLWRKRNMSTYQAVEWTKRKVNEVHARYGPKSAFPILNLDERTPAEIEADCEARKEELQAISRDAEAFIEMGELATVERLYEDLEINDRLDSLVDRALKRLLIRGVKSMSVTASNQKTRRIPPAA
jgi:hypothetical protein